MKKRFFVKDHEVVFYDVADRMNIWSRLTDKRLIGPESDPYLRENIQASLNHMLTEAGLSGDAVRAAYQELLRDAALNLLAYPSCPSNFYPAEIQPNGFPATRISDLLVEASRRLIPMQTLAREVTRDSRVVRLPNYEALLSSLNLTSQEAFLAYRSEEQGVSIARLALLTNTPDETIFRFVYLLKKIKAVEIVAPGAAAPPRPISPQQQPVAPRRPPQAAPPPPAAPGQPAAAAAAAPAAPPSPSPGASTANGETLPPLTYLTNSIVAPNRRPTPPPSAALRREVVKPVAGASGKGKEKEKPGEGTKNGGKGAASSPAQPEARDARAEKLQQANDSFTKAKNWSEGDDADMSKVVYYCREAIEKLPHPKYYHLLARALGTLPGKMREAEEAYHKAIELSPETPDFHMELCEFYIERELWLRAWYHCNRLLQLNPKSEPGRDLKATIAKKKKGSGGCICERK